MRFERFGKFKRFNRSPLNPPRGKLEVFSINKQL
jgi:hypothetical protein